METPVIPMSEEAIELTRWDEEELDIFAFELWQEANCPESPAEEEWMEVEPWCHASCL